MILQNVIEMTITHIKAFSNALYSPVCSSEYIQFHSLNSSVFPTLPTLPLQITEDKIKAFKSSYYILITVKVFKENSCLIWRVKHCTLSLKEWIFTLIPYK